MNMFSQFEPEQMIQGIEIVKKTNFKLNFNEISILKTKLLKAETNPHIIRLARGDGRIEILDNIIKNDSVVFDWGLKSQHAFHKQSNFRNFLEPHSMDIDLMKRIVTIFKNDLAYRYGKNFKNKARNLTTVDGVVRELNDIIDKNKHCQESLLLIKDWICAVLQTAGDADFKNISPWVSTTAGADRFKTAYLFGSCNTAFSKRKMGKNKRFVIFDTWVDINEEHYTYERTQYLIEKLEELGLPWYPDRHHEIMLKYAIYPHNLVGYYYFENDNLLHYQVNPHYLERIKDTLLLK